MTDRSETEARRHPYLERLVGEIIPPSGASASAPSEHEIELSKAISLKRMADLAELNFIAQTSPRKPDEGWGEYFPRLLAMRKELFGGP